MNWNHRVVSRTLDGREYFEIVEVYYDAKQVPCLMTESGSAPIGDTLKELEEEIQMMLKACKHPVITEADLIREEDEP